MTRGQILIKKWLQDNFSCYLDVCFVGDSAKVTDRRGDSLIVTCQDDIIRVDGRIVKNYQKPSLA